MKLSASIRNLLLFSICLLACGHGLAASRLALHGVWQGSLGMEKIMACFDDRKAEYYVQRRPHDIPLTIGQTPGNPVQLAEQNGSSGGMWEIDTISDTQAQGRWIGKEGGPALPIALQRIPDMRDWYSDPQYLSHADCDDIFHDYGLAYRYTPRANAEPVRKSRVLRTNGKPYRKITALKGWMESVELLADDTPTAMARDLLLKHFRHAMMEIIATARNNHDPVARWSRRPTGSLPLYRLGITHWSHQFLSWRIDGEEQIRTLSGGLALHPFAYFDHGTWNLATGRFEDLWDWVANPTQGKSSGVESQAFTDFVVRTVLAGNARTDDKESETADCLALYREGVSASTFALSLGAGGMILTGNYPRVSSVCNREFTIPYADVLPYLNTTGKRAVERILTGSEAEGGQSRCSNADSQHDACGIDGTYLLRILAEPVVPGKTRKMHGQAYRKVSAFGERAISIELLTRDRRSLAMQKRLREDFRQDMARYALACNDSAMLPTRKWKPEVLEGFKLDMELTYLSERWISVEKTYASEFCPGAHPARGCYHLTWNRASAKPVNLWRWIAKSGRVDRGFDDSPYQAPSGGLYRLIQGAFTETYSEGMLYELALGSDGMIFSEGSSSGECRDGIVPYRKLMPFLTEEGKVRVREILK